MKRDKLEVIYSIGIIIAIPLLLVANTVLLVRSTQIAFNNELRQKADLVNAVIAESTSADIASGETKKLQSFLNALEKSQPTITQTMITQTQADKFVIVARADSAPATLNATYTLQARIAYERKRPIAQLVTITQGDRKLQAWNVISPLLDQNGAVLAIVSSNTLTTKAKSAINSAFFTSTLILLVSTVVIVGLLFRHFRMVGYVQLLAKQKELNQTMSDFLSVATHELKAPTTIIKGYIANVMDGTFGPINDTVRDQLQTALSQTDRLNGLVQDLLNVSRIEQGRIEYTYTAVDSQKVLSMIVTNYQAIAAQKGLSLALTSNDAVPLVWADAGRLQEIFTNLIDNAVKYTAVGSVTITQKLDGNMVVTSIKDTGFGMSPDAMKRLFQRFYRVKTAETQTISGTGLGLWIIKQYITAMGGTIDVESMEGVGSMFIVKVPLAKTLTP